MDELSRTDADLISGSLRNPSLFGEIFSRHFTAIFRFAARRLGSDEAGDVASEVFARAFRIRGRYDPSRQDCLPWLYGIAANVVGDRIRRRRRGDARTYLVVGRADDDWDATVAAESRVVAESLVARLNDALGRLSEPDRETFMLFAITGLSYAEIADALGVPQGTVASRINRARHLIREQIPELEQIADRMERPDGGRDDS